MVKRVVTYICETTDYVILLPSSTRQVRFDALNNANWVRDECKRRSCTGYLLCTNNRPMIRTSTLQITTPLCIPEAEIAALSACVWEVFWARSLPSKLALPVTKPTLICHESFGAILYTELLRGLRKVRHTGTKYHYVRSEVEKKTVRGEYTSSAKNCGDCFTTVLIGDIFESHSSWIGVVTTNETQWASRELVEESIRMYIITN